MIERRYFQSLRAALGLIAMVLAATPAAYALPNVKNIAVTASPTPGSVGSYAISFTTIVNESRYIVVMTNAAAPIPASPPTCTYAVPTGSRCLYKQTTAQTQAVALYIGACPSTSNQIRVNAESSTNGQLRVWANQPGIPPGTFCLQIPADVGLVTPGAGVQSASVLTSQDQPPYPSAQYTIPTVPSVTVVVENKVLGNSGGSYLKNLGTFSYVGLNHLGGVKLGFYATDNPAVKFSGSSLPCTRATDSLFPFGDTVVKCTATDGAGNKGTAQFTVSVRQPLASEAPAPTVSVVFEHKVLGKTEGYYLTDLGKFSYVGFPNVGKKMLFFATAKPAQPVGSFVPAWGITELPCTPATNSQFPIGDTTVKCTATDAAGKTVTAQFTINVRGARPGELVPNLSPPVDSKVAPSPIAAPVLAAPTVAPVLRAPTVAPVPALQAVIKIVRAIYGENCRAPLPKADVTAHIAAACNGKTSCAYLVNHTVIGDTAPNCAKTYTVAYQCGATNLTASAPAEASGKTVQLACAAGVR